MSRATGLMLGWNVPTSFLTLYFQAISVNSNIASCLLQEDQIRQIPSNFFVRWS